MFIYHKLPVNLSNLQVDLSEAAYEIVRSSMEIFINCLWIFQKLCADLSEAAYEFVRMLILICPTLHVDLSEAACGF